MKHPNSLLRLGAIATAAALVLSACGSTDDTPDAADGAAACDVKLAYLGPLTGPAANLGLNMVGGIKVAVDEYNAANPDCELSVEEYDSQGNPELATPLASEIVQDSAIIGLIGPAFSGETEATGPTFAEAGLATISPSATAVGLSTNGWDTFHRVLGTDGPQAIAAAKYITDTVGATKVFVVDDAQEYSAGIADGVTKALGDAFIGRDKIQVGQTDMSATVTKAKASGADALFYGGYYAEAGLLAKQLKAGGFTGAFISGDGSLDPGFVEVAGAEGAEGAALTCPCAPNPVDFSADYKALNGADPGTYSAEGYDATNIFLQGIADGNSTREDILAWVNAYDAAGITKQLKFDETGEVAGVTIYVSIVKDGTIQLATPIE